jgi:hypothetical protein
MAVVVYDDFAEQAKIIDKETKRRLEAFHKKHGKPATGIRKAIIIAGARGAVGTHGVEYFNEIYRQEAKQIKYKSINKRKYK